MLFPYGLKLGTVFRDCSEFIKIYSSDGTEVFRQRGCDSLSRGLKLEIPFRGGNNIRLVVLLLYRYSSARIQYTVLDNSFSSGKKFEYSGFETPSKY